MLGSPLLGTAVGLVLLFATTALLCSAITESLSNIFQMRAKYLLTGMRAMLDGPGGAAAGGPNSLERWWTYLKAGRSAWAQAREDKDKKAEGPSGTTEKVEPPATPRDAAPSPDASSPQKKQKPKKTPGPVAVARAAVRRKKRELTAETTRQDVHTRVKEPVKTGAAVTKLRALTADSDRPLTPVVTTAMWDSPLLRSLQSVRINGVGTVRNPQYVSGRTFAKALVDLLVPTDPDGTSAVVVQIDDIHTAVAKLPKELPLRRQLLAFLRRAGTSVTAFERAVEQWYDEQMAKMAGWYKRWARVVLGVVGFLVAVAINIDTIQVGHALYIDAPLQQAVVATANAGTLCQGITDPGQRDGCVKQELDTLHVAGLPFGYGADCDPLGRTWQPCWRWSEKDSPSGWDFPRKLLGWLVTAFAVSFGAPFWFEALSRLGSLRNAGTKPSSSTSPS